MSVTDLNWVGLFDRRPSRREFLRIGGALGGLVTLGAIPGSCTDRELRGVANPFGLGVASGDPAPDGVVLWTRLAADGDPLPSSPVQVRWEVAHDAAFGRVARRGESLALPELGHSVHVEVDGLESERWYFYRFITGGEASPVGRTRTAPAPDSDLQRLQLAFASCQNYEHGHYTAFQHMAAEDLDLVVHLGDYIYEKRFDSSEAIREHEAGEVLTLDDYRGRYSLYRADPHLQAAHAACPWVVTTDDHEVDNNYANGVPEDDQDPAAFLLRRAAAYQAYYEFMPLRRSSMPNGPYLPLYRRLRFGRLAELSVLDTRQYRSDQPCGDGNRPRCEGAFDPAATMTGEPQEQWLFEGLSASDARWNVLANQVMIAQLASVRDGVVTYSMDRWDGYVAARDRLMRFLAQRRPANPVVLTGDIHSNWVADLVLDFDDPASRPLAAEFVGTSISSGGDGVDAPEWAQEMRSHNPHVHFFNGQRGYVRCTVAPDLWRADYRVVPYVSRPGSPIHTRASFVVEDGEPGAKPA